MKLKLETNRSLKELCTFGIGGPARLFTEVRTPAEMQQALLYANSHALRYFILGKGSNCLFDDRGFDGLVILNKIDFLTQLTPTTLHIGAGYSFSLIGTQTARQGLAGLEFASGIPGTVGGAVYMNAGANGRETAETLVSVDFIDDEGKMITFQKNELHFAYRTSSFQNMTGAIVAAQFSLTPSSEARSKQLEIISYRKKTQPYSDMSAGCIFRNPSCGAAGALIDQCQLKGLNIGDAAVSEMHANFIVNRGDASSQDVLSLIAMIQKKVKEEKGIDLESEVRYISSNT